MGKRLMLTSPEAALRLGRCTALVELHLPAGFHALPVSEQERAIRDAATRSVDQTIEALSIHRSIRRSA